MSLETFSGSLSAITRAKETDKITFDSVKKAMDALNRNMLKTYYDEHLKYVIQPPIWIGMDFGREDNMCSSNGVDYEKEELRETVQHLKQNHLGATTERFIEMAREGGRAEHLGNIVRTLESKLANSNDAVRRLSEEVAYRDNEIEKFKNNRDGWMQRAYQVERLYENLKRKNAAAKKPAKKTVAKTTKR